MEQVVELLKNGYSAADIVQAFPKYGFKVNAIESLNQALLAEKYKETLRPVEVTYKFGATGTGKTCSIFREYPTEDICRITSYNKNGVRFDSYKSEDILVFEKYASQIPLEEFLVYLDIYPVMFPVRYADKTACCTKVIITSNLPLDAQYIIEQHKKPETYNALLKRINYVEEFLPNGAV